MSTPKNRNYYADGNAAYDISSYGGVNVVRETEYEDVPQPQQKPKTEVKTVLAHSRVPVASICGFAAVTVLLLLVIFSYVRLYEIAMETTELSTQLKQLETENSRMSDEYTKTVDLGSVELMATGQLGMTRPDRSKVVYVELGNSDRAEIVNDEPGGVKKVIDALLSSIEYIRNCFG